MAHPSRLRSLFLLTLVCGLLVGLAASRAAAEPGEPPTVSAAAAAAKFTPGAKVQRAEHGRSTYLVTFALAPAAPGIQSVEDRVDIARAEVTEEFPADLTTRKFEVLPIVEMSLDSDEALLLASDPQVLAIETPQLWGLFDAESLPLIGGSDAHTLGYTGDGSLVAVVDTGVDTDHPALAANLVGQACFVTAPATCPNGAQSQTTGNAAEARAGQDHGTNVAGIAVSNGGGGTPVGVAPDADLVAVQVAGLGANPPLNNADIISAIDHLVATYPGLDAINLSLGASASTSTCDTALPAFTTAVNAATTAGIAVVAASGNSGQKNGVAFPSCIANAISVGATYDSNFGPISTSVCSDASTAARKVACFSQSSPILELLAPGSHITSAGIGGGQISMSGTSQAAPHVAGAIALLRASEPTLTVADMVSRLQTRDWIEDVTDTWVAGGPNPSGGSRTTPMIHVLRALDLISPTRSVTAPVSTRTTTFTVTVGGEDESGILSYRASTSSSPPGPTSAGWVSNPAIELTLTGLDGTKQFTVWTMDRAYNISAFLTNNILLDRAAPSVSSFNIVPVATNSTTVGINIAGSDPAPASNVDGYCVKTDDTVPLATDPCFVASAPTSATISGLDGMKTLYAFVRDGAGNVSSAVSDEVLLDTEKPGVTFDISPTLSASTNVAVSMSGSDGGGSVINGFCVRTTETVPGPTDGCFSPDTPTDASVLGGDGEQTLYGFTRDAAGNVSNSAQDSVVLDQTPPTTTFDLSAATNGDAVVTTFTGADGSGSGVTHYLARVTDTPPDAADAGWLADAPDDVAVTPINGEKTVYAWVKDAAGNISATESDTTLRDTVLPTVTGVLPAFTNDLAVPAEIDGDDIGGSGVTGFCVRTTDTPPPAASNACFVADAPKSVNVTAPDGPKTVFAFSRDLAGNVSLAAGLSTTLDTAGPTVTAFTINTPSPSTDRTVDVTLAANDGAGSGVDAYLVTESSVAPLAGATGWSATPPGTFEITDAGEGVKTLYGWARDEVGNVGPAATDTITIDAGPPSVTFGVVESVSRGPITFTWDTDDTDIIGYAVTFTDAAPASGSSAWGDDGPPSSGTLTGADGTKTVYGWARDIAGNVSGSAFDTVRLDATPPSVSLSLPAGVTSTTVPVTVGGSDITTPVAFIVSTVGTTPSRTDSRWKPTKPASIVVSATEGTKTVYAWAKDGVGNISARVSDTTVLDATAPIVGLTGPKVTRTRLIALGVTAADSIGVTGYWLSTSPARPAPAVAAPAWVATKPANFTLPPGDGPKTVYLWAKDGVGNVSTTAQVTVRLDTKPPSALLATPANRAKVARIAKVTGTAVDTSGSGVKQVYVSLRRAVRGTTCAHWDGKKWVNRACSKPIWVKAKGTAKWSLAFPAITLAGNYTVSSYATDVAGNKQTKLPAGKSVRKFTVRPASGTASRPSFR